MKRAKVIVLAVLALLSVAAVAKASGVIGGGHENSAYDVVEAKAEALEQKLKARAGSGPADVAARPARGPRGPRGARGPKGPKGAIGPVGPKGTFSSVANVIGPPLFLCSFESGGCAVGTTQATCPPGTILTGGGYTGAGILTTVTWSAPVGNSWAIIAVNLDEVPVTNLKANAECAAA